MALQAWRCSSIIHSTWSAITVQPWRCLVNHPFFLISKWPCKRKSEMSILHSSGSTNDCASSNWSMNHPFFLISNNGSTIVHSSWSGNDRATNLKRDLSIIHSSWSTNDCASLNWSTINHPFFWNSKWPYNLEGVRQSSILLLSKWPCNLKQDTPGIHSSGSANDSAILKVFRQSCILLDQEMNVQPKT